MLRGISQHSSSCKSKEAEHAVGQPHAAQGR